ncbi:MAG: PP2C family protein-serine/threonine phosphatase [Polyangiales bacterium]
MTQAVALVADDNGVVRFMIAQQVSKLGLRVVQAVNGVDALAKLEEEPFDVLLCDVQMPGLDGVGLLKRIKGDARLRHLPVIMISGLEEVKTAAQCIELGAEDYLTKPIDAVLLGARVRASLERSGLRAAEQRYLKALRETQQALQGELEAAADYVRSLLPSPLVQGAIEADWRFIPSMQLGGDAFGYRFLDDDRLAIYVLDVVGHGFRATLLATSVLATLRSQTLGDAVLVDPSAVLAALNNAYPIGEHGGAHFTLWYGVYDRRDRSVRHASAAHPGALLLRGASREPTELSTDNAMLGLEADLAFASGTVTVEPGDVLVAFSDGAFEVKDATGAMASYESFVANLRRPAASIGETLDHGVEFVASRGSPELDDDFCMVAVRFG